jgi:hypothetical protein
MRSSARRPQRSRSSQAILARGDLVVGAPGAEVDTIGDLHRARTAGAALALDAVRGVEEGAVEVTPAAAA